MQNSEALILCRKDKNLSQKNLADILQVSLYTYRLYEWGLVTISLERINILSNIYNVSLDYLLGISNNPKRKIFNREINYKFLKACLFHLRKSAKLSQKKMANEFAISWYSISRYEGSSKNIPIGYIIFIAKKFSISIDYLCGKSIKKEIL